MGLATQVYLGRVQPMHTQSMNRFELFNDICVFIVTQHFLLFTDIVPDSETQFLIGYSCVGVTALCVAVNMYKVLGNIVRFCRLLMTKYGRRFLKRYEPQISALRAKYTEIAEKVLPKKEVLPPV